MFLRDEKEAHREREEILDNLEMQLHKPLGLFIPKVVSYPALSANFALVWSKSVSNHA